jgi:branched-chain amino acid transport system substrate-binding protein
MSRRLVAVVAALLGGVVVVGSAAASSPAPIYVAVEAPLSGSQASNGLDMLRGVELAISQYNAKGGFRGRKVKIIRADDQANASFAKSIARAVVDARTVAVIGPYNSSVGLANLGVYIKGKVVPVQLTSSDDTTGEGVTVQPKNSQISPAEFAYIYGVWKPLRVSMLVDPSAYTQSMADRLQQSLAGKGVLVTQVPITEGQADYSAQVAQALASDPSVVYLSTYFPEGAKIAIALSPSGSSAKCFAGLANQDPGFVAAAGVAASQDCVFSGVPNPEQFSTAKAYVRQYRAKFNKPPGTWGTFTYDSFNILAAAWRKAGSTAYSKVLGQLKKTKNFKGATGPITINARGNRPNVPVSILRVNNAGTFIVITTNRGRAPKAAKT